MDMCYRIFKTWRVVSFNMVKKSLKVMRTLNKFSGIKNDLPYSGEEENLRMRCAGEEDEG